MSPQRVCWVLVTALALACAGATTSCAPLTPTPATAAAPPQAAPRPAPAPVARPAAPIDSTPSPDAMAVLGTIPEPIRAADRVPAPEPGSRAADTSADMGAPDVPVPSPTQPLGERRPTAADTAATPSSAAAPPAGSPGAPPETRPASPPPPAASPPGAPAAGANADTCWRVQIAAPMDPGEAESLRASSGSLLLVDMVIEREAGRYKVRNRDCLTREAADLLRRRAIDSGFPQAFRVKAPRP
jgi:hypothetical protein